MLKYQKSALKSFENVLKLNKNTLSSLKLIKKHIIMKSLSD